MAGWTRIDGAVRGDPDETVLAWHGFQGSLVVKRGKLNGNRFYSHWRAIAPDGWIDAGERKPTAEDADIFGCVLARTVTDEILTIGWRQFEEGRHLTHWQALTDEPGDAG